MKGLSAICMVLVAPGLMWAQASPQKPDSSANNSDVSSELATLREALSKTQKQVTSQQEEIESLKQLLSARPPDSASTQQEAHATDVDSTQPVFTSLSSYHGANAVQQREAQEEGQEKKPPLSFKIGSADIALGGFVDIENIFRTTNTQNNIATNYAAIPFSDTPQGHLTEYRLTAQFSRFSLHVTDKFGGNDVSAYCEADFSGNDATNVYQTVNGHTLRLRLCFFDLKRSKWEILGGQTWSWLTPNRNGVGPMPADLAITYNEDQNIGVGLPYTRAAEFRVAYHANEHWAMGVGIENSNQFIGTFVALPAAFTSIGPQFDNGSQHGAANAFPDILTKVTYDHDFSGRHFHAEAAGFVTGAHASVRPIGDDSFKQHSTVGGGGDFAANYELLPKLVLLGNIFWSDGGA